MALGELFALFESGWNVIPLLALFCFFRALFGNRQWAWVRRLYGDRRFWWLSGVALSIASVFIFLPATNLVRNPDFESNTIYWGTGYFETLIRNGNWPAEWANDLPLYREFVEEQERDRSRKDVRRFTVGRKRFIVAISDGGHDPHEHHGDGYSFRIDHRTSRDGLWSSVSQQVSGLTPTSSYAVRFWVKGEGVQNAFLVLHPEWKRWKCSIPEGTYNWRRVTCPEFSPGGNLEMAEVRFVVDRPSRFWIDDVMFYKISGARRYLCGAWLPDVLGWCP